MSDLNKENEKLELNFKDLGDRLGGFGKFQKWVFFLGCLGPILTGMSVVNIVFAGKELNHRCGIPTCEHSSNASFEQEFLNFTTPFDASRKRWDSCHLYDHESIEKYGNLCDPLSFNSSNPIKCSEWIFDTSEFKSTIVSEYNLVCEKSWMQPLGGSAYMFGMPFGATILGDLADRFGRRRGIVIALSLLGVGELLSSLSVNYYMFLAMRFIAGAGAIATFQVAIIRVLELVSTEWRTFCGMMIKVPFAFGETSVAAFAYFIREWRTLQLTLSIFPFFLISYWWIMPESVRWLVAKGRGKEAKKIIEQAARVNEVEIPQEMYDVLMNMTAVGEAKNRVKRSVFDLFKRPNLRKRTFILMLSWIVITLDFYGLSSNSENLGGNIFINFVAIMLIEVPSYFFAYLILDRLGRKGTMVFLLMFAGIACFLSGMLPQGMDWVVVGLTIAGKFGIAASFAVIYIYTIEIYPTEYRCLGLGNCSTAARIGGILAPFVSNLAKIYKPIPLLIFGFLSILIGSLFLLLPETLGSELPQTLNQSEIFGTFCLFSVTSHCSILRAFHEGNLCKNLPPLKSLRADLQYVDILTKFL